MNAPALDVPGRASYSAQVEDDTLILRPRVQRADEVLRSTRAEIDLSALGHNLRALEELVSPAKILAVVKADAYGHGVVPVARRLAAEGAYAFGVALAEEALELREAGIQNEVLILNGAYGSAHREIVEARLTPVVYEREHLARFAAACPDRVVDVHLKIDTGMSRLGVPFWELSAFLDVIAEHPNLRVSGVMTHLARADDDPEKTASQLARFHDGISMVRAFGHRPVTLHAANSAACFRHPESHLDMVRPGLALFGYPGAAVQEHSLRPVLRFRTEVLSLRTIRVGDTVGYSDAFVASRQTRVATIPVGYGDGVFRSRSGRGDVLIRGARCPLIGKVAMDLSAIDVTDHPDVALHDEVVLLGEQGEERIDAEEIAEWSGTLAYEVLTSVSRRVPRFYR